ncbi:hypothetical protein [Mycoplasmopsis felis]|nr:hypothetical protein [Mycoplasmopsis felis]WQQ03241.1 hypothetical protein RRG38_03815 [Mycoplasmopsis felis]
MNIEELKMKFWNQIINNNFNVSQAKEDLILQGMIDDLKNMYFKEKTNV